MRRLDVLVCVLVALFGVPALGFGQWLRYPTAGVPRKADGKPELTAPAPRLPDGKPADDGPGNAAEGGSWWPIVLLIPVLLVVRAFVIAPEERYLERRFGADYLAYMQRVRRWL